MEELLIKSLKRIMSLKDGIHAHAYQIGDFVEISVDNLDFYFNNKSFKKLQKEIKKEFFDKLNMKVGFVTHDFYLGCLKCKDLKDIVIGFYDKK